MRSSRNSPAGALWAITSYFNPMRYRRRRENYRLFRRRLTLPLVTVELSFDGAFDLRRDEAEILLQLSGGDVMWQKERLLNVALHEVPRECDKVAWLDCDVIFAREDWAERASRSLERCALVQPFSRVCHLGPDWQGSVAPEQECVGRRPSLAAGVVSGLPAAACFAHPAPEQRPGTYACGLAWAGRRQLMEQHGFFDANIIGGGDRSIACGAYGCFEHEVEHHYLNARQRDYYLAWAQPFHEACGGQVAVVDGDLHHLWHGEVASRGLGARQSGLRRFHFDPYEDIAVDASGCWRWSSDKPEMHRYVRDYFASRREDG
jgi:hypothetical protein